jgi:indole-3-glycerol phosphate synthase
MKFDFADAIVRKKRTGMAPVIPDFKPVSPKEGDLFKGRNPVEAARLLASFGAPALSVVTRGEEFGGSMRLLEKIVNAAMLPVLRKDFIKDADDVKRTRDAGAAAVLLICASLDERGLRDLYEEATNAGLEPLVEAHTARELELAGELGARLVGINNRDILSLERDGGTVSLTELLAAAAPADALLISESGIISAAEVRAAINAGADAVLVGTAIWMAEDMGAFYKSLCLAGSAVS